MKSLFLLMLTVFSLTSEKSFAALSSTTNDVKVLYSVLPVTREYNTNEVIATGMFVPGNARVTRIVVRPQITATKAWLGDPETFMSAQFFCKVGTAATPNLFFPPTASSSTDHIDVPMGGMNQEPWLKVPEAVEIQLLIVDGNFSGATPVTRYATGEAIEIFVYYVQE